MKSKIIIVLLIAGIAAAVSAQGWGPRRSLPNNPPERIQRPAAETVSVSGSLAVAHGMPAITSGGVFYLIVGANRLVGFIDGFKEGAQVSIDGTAITNPQNANVKFLRPAKMTLGGKSYDLSSPFDMQNFLRNRLPQQNNPPQWQRTPPPPQNMPRQRNAPPRPQLRQRQL